MSEVSSVFGFAVAASNLLIISVYGEFATDVAEKLCDLWKTDTVVRIRMKAGLKDVMTA